MVQAYLILELFLLTMLFQNCPKLAQLTVHATLPIGLYNYEPFAVLLFVNSLVELGF